jgi:hypothetical protein
MTKLTKIQQLIIYRYAHKLVVNKVVSPPPPPMAQQSLVGQGHLIIEDSRSHSGTPHSVGLLWTSDQPAAETST